MPTVKQLRVMARELKVSRYSRMTKADLIRAIQSAEGNQPCFEQIPGCGQDDCLFLLECQGREPALP